MNLSQTQKTVVAIFTLLPFLLGPYVIYQIFQFVLDTIETSQYGEPEPEVILAGIISFIFPIILISLISLGLLIFYIIHVANNKAIDTTERIVWILVFVFMGIIAFPIYLFMRIWNEGR